MRTKRRFVLLWLLFLGVAPGFLVLAMFRAFERPPPVVRISLTDARLLKPSGASRDRTCVCEVVLDNQSSEVLSIACTVAPFDGLRLLLYYGELNVIEQPYAPPNLERPTRSFRLPPGQTQATLEFPIRLPSGLDPIDAQIMGALPKSRFEGVLESNMVRVRRDETRAVD